MLTAAKRRWTTLDCPQRKAQLWPTGHQAVVRQPAQQHGLASASARSCGGSQSWLSVLSRLMLWPQARSCLICTQCLMGRGTVSSCQRAKGRRAKARGKVTGLPRARGEGRGSLETLSNQNLELMIATTFRYCCYCHKHPRSAPHAVVACSASANQNPP